MACTHASAASAEPGNQAWPTLASSSTTRAPPGSGPWAVAVGEEAGVALLVVEAAEAGSVVSPSRSRRTSRRPSPDSRTAPPTIDHGTRFRFGAPGGPVGTRRP